MKIIEINEQNIHLLFKGRARTATFKEAIVAKKSTNSRSLDHFAARYFEKFDKVGFLAYHYHGAGSEEFNTVLNSSILSLKWRVNTPGNVR